MPLLLLASTLAVLLGAPVVIAQSPSVAAEQPPVFRSAASLVSLNVSVTDPNGRHYVTDLARADFAVFEDGVQQQVTFFESSQVPVDLILMLDTSSSMADKIQTVHLAAINFLKTLRSVDRGAVITFSDGVQIVEGLTSDQARLEQAVLQTSARGGTALNNALYVALRQFGGTTKESAVVRRRAIALLTDGEDTSSLVSFDDVVALARKAGVNIYTIALQTPPISGQTAHRVLSKSQYQLKTLSQESGAEAFFPEQIGELQGVYAAIAQELSSQYSLGYSPTNGRPDGRFRRISVRVVNRPELKLRARAGYTADGDSSLDSIRR